MLLGSPRRNNIMLNRISFSEAKKGKLKMIKKVLTYSVAIATVVWSVGLLATPLAVGAAVSGDLIKLQCSAGADVNDPCKAVYYLGADGKRYVFPNEKTYMTWYSDFSGVMTVSETEMSSYSIGGNVTYRPGVKLVKITTDPKVYAVAGDGTLMWVTTGDIAESLYGAGWASMIDDIPDAFFVNYTVGSDVNAAGDYDKDGEMTDSATINEDKGLGGGGSVSTGTSLSVALAADTPASGLIVGNSINNKFTKVTLTASADGDIVIDQLVVRRGGTIASDTPFGSIALIDASTGARIDNTKTLNSDHQAVFNKDMTIPAGTTKTLYLAGNMASSLASYAGEIPTLDLYSVTLKGTAAVVGTLPIVGNYQTLNGTITIGTLTLQNGSNNPSAATQKIGTTNYLVSGVKLTAGSAEDFHVTSITFDQGGTASDSDVDNIDLFVDDALKASGASVNDGKVTFDLSADPILIEKGKSVDVDLQLDIEDGSDRTIRFDIEDESDVRAMGQLYGSEVKVSAGTGATADATPFWTAQITTIDRGALRVGAATLSNANVPEDADQLVLGKFEFETTGEDVEVTELPIAFLITTSTGSLATTGDLTNVTVYDEDGDIVAGPIDPTHKHYDVGGTTKTQLLVATTTDTITIPDGVNYYTIKADISSDFGTNDTIQVRINPGQITAKGSTTGLTVTATPSSDQTSATMTVKTASLNLSNSNQPVAQTVVKGSKGVTFANLILGAEGSGEDIKVTKVVATVKCDGSCNPAEVSNWSIFDGSTELSVTNNPDSDTSAKTTDGNDATATFMFSTPLVITKGTSKTLTVKGDVSTAATNGNMNVGFIDSDEDNHITAKGNDTGLSLSDSSMTLSIDSDGEPGQAMTFGSGGGLTITRSTGTPDEGYLPANTDGITVLELLAEAEDEAVKIEKIYFTATQVNSGGLDQIEMLHLYNGSDLVASKQPTTTDAVDGTVEIDMTGSPIEVPKDDYITLTVKVDTPVLNYKQNGGNSSGLPTSFEGFSIKINAAGDVTAKGVQSGGDITPTISSAEGNSMYLVRSYPTITLDESGGSIVAGDNTEDLASFTVAANSSGDVGVFSVSYYISTTTASLSNVYLYEGGTKVATASSTVISSGSGGSGHEEVATFVLTDDGAAWDWTGPTSTDDVLPNESIIDAGSSKTYTLRADVECNTIDCNAATNPTGGSVNVKFLGDDSIVGADAIAASDTIEDPDAYVYEYSFLWSDFWRTPTLKNASTTATSTEQWLNGYKLKTSSGNYLEATSTGAKWSK